MDDSPMQNIYPPQQPEAQLPPYNEQQPGSLQVNFQSEYASMTRGELDAQLTSAKSQVVVDRTTSGVVTYDQQVIDNTQDLWQYILSYSKEKPLCFLSLSGTHQTSSGESQSTITDFKLKVDLSEFISDIWTNLVSFQQGESIREQFKTICMSTTHIKEVRAIRYVAGWDQQKVHDHFKDVIRSFYSYRERVHVKFEYANHKIVARSNNLMLKTRNNTWAKVLCCISCIWILFLPLYLVWKKLRYRYHLLFPVTVPNDYIIRAVEPLLVQCMAQRDFVEATLRADGTMMINQSRRNPINQVQPLVQRV